ncbi:MAG TPA: flagellar biosynthetic protein FliO [Mobilitalea sp.]|nr:flagellar biosynthetic protein FliO [Mobilitalea sp.]
MYGKTMVILADILSKVKASATSSANQSLTDNIANGVTTTGSTTDNFLQLVGLVFLLIIILVASYYTTKFVGGIKVNQMKNSNFEVIDSYRISTNKVIQIVKIANKYVVIAIGKDTINYITELDEAEVYIRDMNAGDKLSFKKTLDKLRNMNK